MKPKPLFQTSKIVSLISYLFSLAPSAHAFDLNTALHINETDTVDSTFATPWELVSQILPNVYIVAGLILMFIAFGAGISLIQNSGNPEAQAKSKQALGGAIMGFAIIFASYWIIQAIQVITGVTILEPTWTL